MRKAQARDFRLNEPDFRISRKKPDDQVKLRESDLFVRTTTIGYGHGESGKTRKREISSKGLVLWEKTCKKWQLGARTAKRGGHLAPETPASKRGKRLQQLTEGTPTSTKTKRRRTQL